MMIQYKRNSSPEIRFNLSNPKNQDRPTSINVVIPCGKKTNGNASYLKRSTKIKVPPKYWDINKQRVKKSVNYDPQTRKVQNEKLDRIASIVEQILHDHPNITREQLGRIYKGFADKNFKDNETITDLISYTNDYINRKSTQKEYRTILKYKSSKNSLKKYADYLGQDIYLTDLNETFFDRYVKWLYDHTKTNSPNEVNKKIEFINQVAESAVRAGLLETYHKYNVKRKPTTKTILELKELQILLEADLRYSQRLERTRDLWCIMALTGLRYSNLIRIKPHHFREYQGEYIMEVKEYKGRTSKNERNLIIPVLPDLKKILERYDYNITDSLITSQKLGEYIKELCLKLEINRLMEYESYVNGQQVLKEIPIYKKISAHTARYTFIHVMVNDYNYPYDKVRKITGQSLRVIASYDRTGKRKAAESIMDDFYQKPNTKND